MGQSFRNDLVSGVKTHLEYDFGRSEFSDHKRVIHEADVIGEPTKGEYSDDSHHHHRHTTILTLFHSI